LSFSDAAPWLQDSLPGDDFFASADSCEWSKMVGDTLTVCKWYSAKCPTLSKW